MQSSTAGAGVLPGIAQQIIFEIVPVILPVKREAVNVREIPQFSEAFISGSSRGIVPVVEIDGITLGIGRPGPFNTKASGQLTQHGCKRIWRA